MASNQDIYDATFFNPGNNKYVGQIKGSDGKITMGGNGTDGELWIKDGSGNSAASVKSSGELALRLAGNPTIHMFSADGTGWFGGSNVAGNIRIRNNRDKVTLKLSGQDSLVSLRDGNGDTRIELNGQDGKITFMEGGQTKVSMDASGVRAQVDVGAVPDYVFGKDYPLRPLEEVKRFSSCHGHLPDMPAAEQVEREGLDLTKMCLDLLQKVEELTLYSISQEERLNQLTDHVHMLEDLLDRKK